MDRNNSNGNKLFKLRNFLANHKLLLFLLVVASLGIALIDILMAYFMRNLIDSSLAAQRNQIVTTALFLLGTLITGVIMKYMMVMSSGRLSARVVFDIRNRFSGHLSKTQVTFMEAGNSGDIISRHNNDIAIIDSFLKNSISDLMYQPVVFICAFTFLLITSWKLLLINVILFPVAFIVVSKMSAPIMNYSNQIQKYFGEANAVLKGTLDGIHTIKSFNAEPIMETKYRNIIKQATDVGATAEKRRALMIPFSVVLQILPFLLCFMFGGYLVIQKQITPGSMMISIYMLNFLINPAVALINQINNIQNVKGAIGRIQEVLSYPVEKEGGLRVENESSHTVVEFNEVTFAYDERTKVLSGLNLKVEKGKTIAIVGTSNSGKSTILKLICSLYKQQQGSIKMFGYDINDLDPVSLRDKISFVFQDTYLFPGSIIENIMYGKSGCTREEAIIAAKQAKAHDFIVRLPNSYDTEVGENGIKLSGGQKQRITVARAIIKNSPLFILDEPTSALDSQSEYAFQEILKESFKDKTVIVISHRLSTIVHADEILVLDQGKIIRKGTHEELVKSAGLYKDIFISQLRDSKNAQSEFGEEIYEL